MVQAALIQRPVPENPRVMNFDDGEHYFDRVAERVRPEEDPGEIYEHKCERGLRQLEAQRLTINM